MKNFTRLSLSIVLLSTISVAVNAEELNKRPDAIYEKTINNPEIGAPSSLNEPTDPLAGVEKIKIPELPKKKEKPSDESSQKPMMNDKSITYAVPESSSPQVATVEGKAPVIEVIEEKPIKKIAEKEVEKATEAKEAEVKAAEIKAPEIKKPTAKVKKTKEPEQAKIETPVLSKPASLAFKDMQKSAKKSAVEKPAEKAEAKPVEKTERSEKKEIKNAPIVFADLPSADELKAGQCITKVTIFGKTKQIEEDVLVQPATEKKVKVEAKYKEVDEVVVIKEARTQIIEIPTSYKTINEEVVISPEKTEELVTPAEYSEITERVLVKPAQKVWKDDSKDGNLRKLVEEPAVFEDKTRKILVKEEIRDKKTIPAVTKTVQKKVVDQEARVETKVIPAVTKTIKKQVLVEDEHIKTIKEPAVYKREARTIQITPDREEWQPALCKDTNRDDIKKLQQALVAKGYKIKDIDGIMGKETQKAVAEYQKSLGFKSDYITAQAEKELNLN